MIIEAHKKIRIVSLETRRKMSEARKGIILNAETRKRMSEAQKGKTLPFETRRKMSEAGKGRKFSPETRQKISDALREEKSIFWKGDNVGYSTLHKWVRKKLGKARLCVICGRKHGIFHWANKDHKYRRILDDWIQLCHLCHNEYDKIINNKHVGRKKKNIWL